jgi:hypothetical protein
LAGVRNCAGQPLIAPMETGKWSMLYAKLEYHRRRCEVELEKAVEAERLEIATAHLELARLHRAQRQAIAEKGLESFRLMRSPSILRTDKEA